MWDNIQTHKDNAENVTKLVFIKADAVAEAVLYRYPTYQERTVICCSTMSGCPMGCRFCGAGDYFVRSLTNDEIIDQVEECIKLSETPATDMAKLQIMFMSMGEPLLNLKQLDPAIRRLSVMYPRARLLISTSAPIINYEDVISLSVDVPAVGLQFSVHESTDTARDELIPFEKKLNLKQISIEGNKWFLATGRKPFFNYCAHDKNSTQEDADRLYTLFPPVIWNATVSVVCERNDGMPATSEYQRSLAVDFSEKLVTLGFDVRVFDPAGQSTIGGGCGQLWFVQDWMKTNPDKARPSIGCDKPVVHATLHVATSH